MVLVRSQYLSDRTLYDHVSGIVENKELWAVFLIKFEKNRSKRVSTPTPENKLDILGGKLDLLGERLPTCSSFFPFEKKPRMARSCLLKCFLRIALLCYWKPFVRSFAQVLSFHVPAVACCWKSRLERWCENSKPHACQTRLKKEKT